MAAPLLSPKSENVKLLCCFALVETKPSRLKPKKR